jgi:hypothetical protein
MMNPTTAAALARARQDDVERMLRDPRWMARQELRYDRRRSLAVRPTRTSPLSSIRRVVSAALGPRTARTA